MFNKNTVEDGKYINSAGEIQPYYAYALSDYIVVNPSTEYSYQGISAFSERLAYYDKNKNLISTDIVSALPQYQKITTPSNCYYFRTTVLKVDIDKYQFEESSTPTNYVEHKEQTFIFPLGNEKLMLGDYLADDGIHHVRRQITFNGTEDFGSIIEDEYLQFYLYLNLNTIKDGNAHNIISNNYIGVARNLAMNNNNQISASSAYLRIRDDRFETVNDFKTWLQTQYNNGTPIIAEYRLAEEVIVPYTSAQQEVYNQIKNALSYEEQTNISGSSNGNNPIFTVEAYQSTKLILQNIDSRLTLVEG